MGADVVKSDTVLKRPPEARAVAAALAEGLAAAADDETRRWWDRYMKGAVPFRGVPMATTRRILHDTWVATGADGLSTETQIEMALAQLGEPYCEDKLAGVLALSERLLEHLRIDHVTALASPFERRHIDDWGTCDWYCVKVLGRFIASGADRRSRADAIAGWRHAPSLWQRRAAAVSFVNLAPQGEAFLPGLTDLLLTVCARNVEDPARFSQTSVGWLLRELSRAEPAAVQAFVDSHRPSMSREAWKAATARLPGDHLRQPAT